MAASKPKYVEVTKAEFREMLSSIERVINSADTFAATKGKGVDWSVLRVKIKLARERMGKLWRHVR